MTRVIKFRGKCAMTDKWLYGYLVEDRGMSAIVTDARIYGEDYPWVKRIYEVDADTTGQYTGLEDKNGVAVYEGDILKRKFEIGHTIYNPVTHGVVDYEISDSGYFIGVAHYRPSEGFVLAKVRKYNDENELIEKKSAVKIYPRYAEIIGNCFDNPELLEVTN